MLLGMLTQAPFLSLLLTAVSMKAMPFQPSSTLAYFEPSFLNDSPASYLRTSASKQRCRRNRGLRHKVARHILRQEAVARRDRSAPVNAVWLVRQVNGNGFGLFLAPAQGAFGAANFDAEIVFVADRNLRCTHQSSGAIA